MIRAFSCAVAGFEEVSGPDAGAEAEAEDEGGDGDAFLGGGDFFTVERGDLGDEVGGSSGFTSGIGCGRLSTAS